MKVIRVSFSEAAKYYYFNPNNLDLKDGDIVIVDTKGARDNGKVIGSVFDLDKKKFDKELKKVIRIANSYDRTKIEANKIAEQKLFEVFKEKSKLHKLRLKPLRASLSFDEKKVIFFYFSEKKVDFRELLKDLLSVTQKKIELRQVEARDEVKLIGGMGICGQRCCCNLFLSGRESVGIRMAKDQGLPLNPEKISGTCGKLMCCLRFENETYRKQSKDMPKKNKIMSIDNRPMKVIESNVLLEQIKLKEVLNERDDNGNKLLSEEVEIMTKEEFLEKTQSKSSKLEKKSESDGYKRNKKTN